MSNDRLVVLCVDDDPDTRVIIEISLALDPFLSVVVVGSGLEALKLINNGLQPDVLLLDILLPQMNGIEIATEILKRYANNGPAVVFLTAYTGRVGDLNDHGIGSASIILKPFDPVKLAADVRVATYSQWMQRDRR